MTERLPRYLQRLLREQHGVIAAWQSTMAGLGAREIEVRLNSGRWQRLYRGVYASFTGPPPRLAWLWAAALRAGPGSALSHYTAAELDGLTDRSCPAIHVTVGGDRRLRLHEDQPGVPPVIVHRSRRIEEIRHPVRTPPRTRIPATLVDLTQLAPTIDDAVGWLAGACGRRMVTPRQIQEEIAARPKLRWRRQLLGALGDAAAGSHSLLEFRYRRDVARAHGLPASRRQVTVALPGRQARLDDLYEPYGVGVELDGAAYHRAEDGWRDRHRDNACAAAGIVILRYGWTDVTSRPCAVAAEIAAVLRQRGWSGRPGRCGSACTAADS